MIVQPRDDTSCMLEAVSLAARIPARPWPNPPVGAIVVANDGVIVGRGAHHGAGTLHAEAVALDQAGERARGGTLYCTLEPCNHQGRTPPCAPRVAASGLRRVVVGVRDPNPGVAGRGLERIRAAGVTTTLGVAADACLDLIWPFVVSHAFARPFVLLKTATSLDGRFAPAPAAGRLAAPVYLTGLEARREVHRLRRWADLVLVGAGTVRVDRPVLDGRLAVESDLCPAADPRPGYVDADLAVDVSWSARAFLAFGGCRSAAPDRVRAVQERGGAVVLCEEHDGLVVPASLLERLAGLGILSVLVEGGPRLAQSFLSSGLVDRWESFVAPTFLADGVGWPTGDTTGSRPGPRRCDFHLTRCSRIGGDARLVYDRVSFEETRRQLTQATEA